MMTVSDAFLADAITAVIPYAIFTIVIPYAIFACIKAHRDTLDQDEWHS